MEAAGWILAALFGVLALVLAIRRRPRATTAGGPASRSDAAAGNEGAESAVDEDEALREMARYLERAVTAPLEEALRAGDVEGAVDDAVDALRDLIAFGRVKSPGARSQENLLSVLHDVTREYTLESGVPVKLTAPEAPIVVMLEAEPFKDAVYLLLSNAGRFGRGQTIDVVVERKGGDAEVGVRDRGPGFSGEALLRAFRPFWSSESDALGLGLPHAKKLIEKQGGKLRIGNRSEQGAEAVVSIPVAHGNS